MNNVRDEKKVERLTKIYEESCEAFKQSVTLAQFIEGEWGTPMDPGFFMAEMLKNLSQDRLQMELSGGEA